MSQSSLKRSTANFPFTDIAKAMVIVCSSLASAAQAQTTLQPVEITAQVPTTLLPTETAPSQGSLQARSAQSIVGNQFIRDYTNPVANFTEVLTMTPGAYSYSSNGAGLSDNKVTLRGLPESNMVYSFDGIPFNDTNGVSHHSWVFFPTQFLGGATVDRSPGSAATIGQATFGGGIDLKSRELETEPRTSVTASTGTWRTNLLGVEHETGQVGADGKSNLLINAHEMQSDGYQTYNKQQRKAISGKYQFENTAGSVFTVFASDLNLTSNTPSIKGLARSNYDQGNYNYLMSSDPTRGDFYGYNFYDVTTDFVYAGINTKLDNGWNLDDKVYTYRYWNKQNYNGTGVNPVINSTSAVDKLNSYTVIGNNLRMSKEDAIGTLRTGLWVDKAYSYRFQTPSDPRTWIDSAIPNFSETYTTTTMQPYVEYEYKATSDLKITPGVKYATYKQEFNHLADNGGAVGNLGGAASINNDITYNDILPSLDVHYQVTPQWSTYAQYAFGDQIPDTGVFDVPNAAPLNTPKPTLAKTIQFGTVYTAGPLTLAGDVYRTALEGAYTKVVIDAAGNTNWVYSGVEINQGVEAEANVALGSGFSVYVNGTVGSFKYDNGQWVQGAPQDTETLALNYQRDSWSANLSANRVGQMFYDGSVNATAPNTGKIPVHEIYAIDPVTVVNMFVNYTIKKPFTTAKQAKIQFAIDNLMDSHSITGVAAPTNGATAPTATDLLNILPGRSISLTATIDF
jgi:iron complex outermembrane receptor protein